MKHTPGPWSLDPDDDTFGTGCMAVNATGGPVAHVESWTDDVEMRKEALANGRLIEAAPDLLEACNQLRAELGASVQLNNGALRALKFSAAVIAAIEKEN